MSESTERTDGDGHQFSGSGSLERALTLVRFLRKECPWDREQTAESLIPYLLEETHEVIDAIREGSAADLEAELGDLLLNLAFQIVVAEEEDTLEDSRADRPDLEAPRNRLGSARVGITDRRDRSPFELS